MLAIFAVGNHTGAKRVRGEWAVETVKIQTAEKALILANEKRNQAVYEANNRKNIEVSNAHTKELAKIIVERNRLRTERVRFAIPVGNCLTIRTEAASTGGYNETGAGTVALPEALTTSLLDITEDADKVSAQLRSCQFWIKENGFYGVVK